MYYCGTKAVKQIRNSPFGEIELLVAETTVGYDLNNSISRSNYDRLNCSASKGSNTDADSTQRDNSQRLIPSISAAKSTKEGNIFQT